MASQHIESSADAELPLPNAQELVSEVLPGTEIMTDIEGVHFVHGRDSNHVVLVPQPSMSPHDPLNWNNKWKYGVLINQGLFVIFSVITNLSIAPLTPIYMAEWNKNQQQISLLTGATIITLGYANFIIVPACDVFGRRPVILMCGLIVLAANVWLALAGSYNSFLGARLVSGIGAAANESIMLVVVADVFFLHERGRFVGFYFWCYFVGLFIGPIISGQIASRVSWRWFFWVCTVAQGLNTLALLLSFPETRRTKDQFPPVQTVTANVPIREVGVGNDKTEVEVCVESANSKPESSEEPAAPTGQGTPSRAQFNILQPPQMDAVKMIFRHIVTPIQLFFFPIVCWAAWATGSAANALLAVNLTQSQVLSAPPYNFSPAQVGFANFALVAGGVLGLVAAGPLSDWVAMRSTKKNKGIREAEMRLSALYPFIAAALVGMVIVGVGYQQRWAWKVIIMLGFTLVGVQVVAIPAISVAYAVDCYKPVAGQIMVIVTVTKNTFGFGMTYFMNDWAIKDGFIPPIFLLMAMTVGFTLIGTALLPFFGKQFRVWTRNAVVHTF
ncbi:uncharacterized protein A1O5_06183 [Cladophialophora psammophila CBS 110553]|uniref:Major facilitator superfamily (MFS) profile domain-containing protein n=1 Tax=Cladophialophora psammophila CBS 110553 TaxID=1182543 RepID=W9XLE5_9EURO|nr:uncharacterized protein A1O5_06183 [Cladophialophora psammophila CBS 110553]EXJ71189.1 hypothetical protein A1O5_06183 [Cladophialophora psammophila CBS 110553]